MPSTPLAIAVLGGTGDLGSGLAYRWARAGHDVIIGSRAAEKAEASAHELAARVGRPVRGLDNAAASAAAAIVAIAVPWGSHASTLETIKAAAQGKILIDTTVPLVPPRVGTVQLPEGGSAAVAAQALLGDGVKVVSAFQNVAAAKLQQDMEIECDVLVCGNDQAARETVLGLVADAGLKGWHAGPLANSVVAEALTSVLITLNRRYKIEGAGIRITGEPKA